AASRGRRRYGTQTNGTFAVPKDPLPGPSACYRMGMTIAQEAEKTTAARLKRLKQTVRRAGCARSTAGAERGGRPSAVQRRDAIDHGDAPARCCSVERGSS